MREVVIGIISDTHGVVREAALKELAGCDLILHAGDVGGPEVLPALAELAPVVAVRGNAPPDENLDLWSHATVHVAGLAIQVVHRLSDRVAGAYQVIIYGHSHVAETVEGPDGVWYINPGSAGPWRYYRTPSLAILKVANGIVNAHIVKLPRENTGPGAGYTSDVKLVTGYVKPVYRTSLRQQGRVTFTVTGGHDA